MNRFCWTIKKLDNYDGNATDVGADPTMFVLTILEENEEARLKFSQGSITVL